MLFVRMTIQFVARGPSDIPNIRAKGTLVFSSGPLAGLMLTGFIIWKAKGKDELNVTFPANTYTSSTGQKQHYWFLRSQTEDQTAVVALQKWIETRYLEWVETL